jgi:hypothetical protein
MVAVAVVWYDRRQRPAVPERPDPNILGESAPHRLDRLDQVERRLAEVEERLDFAERLLARRSDAERLHRPNR